MTDNDIVKAFECCNLDACNCLGGCPYLGTSGAWRGEECWRKAREDLFDLINRQKAEIERLKDMVGQNEGVLPQYENLIKAEAIKEFAERLKEIDDYVSPLDIDNLVKEMTEGNGNADEN